MPITTRTCTLVGTLLLLLGISFAPVAAAPVDDLTALAQYAPAESSLYFAIRTDQAYLDQLNGILGAVDDKLGGVLPDEANLPDLLNATLSNNLGRDTDFAEEIRPWLGDTAAFIATVPNPDEISFDVDADEPYIFAFAIADFDAAQDFWDAFAEDADYETDEVDDGILYSPPDDGRLNRTPMFYLNDEVLLLRYSALDPDSLLPKADVATLADADKFIAAMERLPLDDYNGIFYGEPNLFTFQLEQVQEELAFSGLPFADVDLLALATAIGPQSGGFTILDERNFVLDIATNVDDRAALMDAGISLPRGDALDLVFTDNLPASTMLFLQDTGLGAGLIGALEQLEMLGDFYDEQWEAGELSWRDRNLRNLDDTAIFIRQAIEGLAGLTLDEAFGWMTGDYIVYANALPGNSEVIPALPDFGVLVADTGDASLLADAIPDVLYQLGLDAQDEDGISVIKTFGNLVGTDAVDILLGQRDGIYVTGTRATVGPVLAGEGGITESAVFSNASQYFVADAQLLAFINVPPIAELVTTLDELGVPDLEDAALVLPVFESASVSMAYDENGTGAVRMVFTLAE